MTSLCRKYIVGVLLCVCASPIIRAEAFAFDKKTSSALTHYIMGVYYDDVGDIEKAIEEYQRAGNLDTESPLIHLNLASDYVKKGDIPRATQELNLAAKLNPEAVEPHAILALLYSSQNKIDQAAAEYEIALTNASRLQPQNVAISKSLGLIYLQQRKYKDAQNTFRLIAELFPNDAEAHFYLGSISNELKENALAEKELKRTLELKPDFHEALNFLGYLYVEQDRNFGQAESMIKKAIELDPNNGAYIDSLGWLYFKKNKLTEAIQELEKASGLLDDPVIFDHLGDAYFKLKNTAKAQISWEKSLQLDPAQEAVKKKLERLPKPVQ